MLIAIDPAFKHTGAVIYDEQKKTIKSFIQIYNDLDDMSYSYASYREVFSNIYESIDKPCFTLIESTYIPGIAGIISQKHTFGVVSIILSLVGDDEGYMLYSMHSAYAFWKIPRGEKHKKLALRKAVIDFLKSKNMLSTDIPIHNYELLDGSYVMQPTFYTKDKDITEDVIDSIGIAVAFMSKQGERRKDG